MELKSILNIPEGVFPVVILSLGYPKAKPPVANKLGAEILVHEEGYEDIPMENIISAHDKKYNHRKFPCSDSNMSEMRKVTMDVGGKEYSDKIMKSIEEQGYINMAQRYFGLHYQANWSCTGNKAFKEALLAYGFSWIEGVDFP